MDINKVLMSSKNDIGKAWDEVIDAVNEMQDDYESRIVELEKKIKELTKNP